MTEGRRTVNDSSLKHGLDRYHSNKNYQLVFWVDELGVVGNPIITKILHAGGGGWRNVMKGCKDKNLCLQRCFPFQTIRKSIECGMKHIGH